MSVVLDTLPSESRSHPVIKESHLGESCFVCPEVCVGVCLAAAAAAALDVSNVFNYFLEAPSRPERGVL